MRPSDAVTSSSIAALYLLFAGRPTELWDLRTRQATAEVVRLVQIRPYVESGLSPVSAS
jgi:hypothetical protein